MIPENPEYYKLFYVDPHSKDSCPEVHFTTGKVSEEWGDDWNDAPWEHNAGRPYQNGGGQYFVMRIESGHNSNIKTPDEYANYANSPYSVEMINKGLVPWMSVDIWNPEAREYEQHNNLFHSGTTLKEFIERAKRCDLKMWFNLKP